MTAEKRNVQRITDNPELVAINKVDKILTALDSGQRSRVMGFIGQKLYDEQAKARAAEREQFLSAGSSNGKSCESAGSGEAGPVPAGAVMTSN